MERHSYNAEISKRDLYETYLPAFKALVLEGNVREVMCAYNALTDNLVVLTILYLMTSFVENGNMTEWWFPIVGLWQIFIRKIPRNASRRKKYRTDALKHSTDLECGDTYNNLNKSLASGLITEKDLDISMRRI
jgi:beta-glucosidase